MPARTAVVVAGALIAAAVPASARAGDPIMPLSEVRSGMACTGLSVVRGTEISSFDVEVIDVVAGDPSSSGPRILVRASGPAVDETGIGAGFSGSPVYCDGRVAGAISQSIGEHGNEVVLATPIEEVLGETPDPPRGARRDPALLARARPLAAPLTVGGVGPALARDLVAAGRRAGRPVLAVPAGPLGSFPPQELRPGSAVSTGLSSGDLPLGSIGTVTYVDGDRIWAFGHPLDGVGARSLLLQDAYVFTVVSNPFGVDPAVSYKLASPGHDLGALTNDAFGAVVGRTGVLPRTIPVRAVTQDLDRGGVAVLDLRVADEAELGFPAGASALSLAGPLALVQGAAGTLRSLPARLSGSMCFRVELEGRDEPIRFCNEYVSVSSAAGTGGIGVLLADYLSAVSLLDSYNFGPLRLTRVETNVKLRRGARQAYALRASAPRRVRRGSRPLVTLSIREVNGRARRVRFRVRVPRSLRPGLYELRLAGKGPDSGLEEFVIELEELLALEDEEPDAGDPGPRSVDELAAEIEAIERYDGMSARFTRPGRRHAIAEVERAYRDPVLRIGGRASVPLRVVR